MSERINLTPAIWGPHTWFFLDSMAMAYPDNPTNEEQTSAKNLLLSLRDLLPCWGCRVNYTNYTNEYFKINPIENIVKKRSSLVTFIIDVHNDVRTRYKQDPKSVEETFKYYNQAYLSPPPSIKIEPEQFTQKKRDMQVDRFESTIVLKSLLYQFNPIMILIGIIIGLIIYKFFQETIKYNLET
jgi:hypothetical protein